MNLESQVVSLPLAKRLKELGVKQESLFAWVKPVGAWKEYVTINTPLLYDETVSAGSAFTVAELGEMLPDATGSFYQRLAVDLHDTKWWFCAYDKQVDEHGPVINPHMEKALTEADARAKMLVYLIEKGIVKP